MEKKEMIRIVVMQGHRQLPAQLIDRVNESGAVEICEQVKTTDEARIAIALHRPQVLLTCCSGQFDPMQFKHEFHWLPVVVFCCDAQWEMSHPGAELPVGADAYVSVEDTFTDFTAAIRAAVNGDSFVSERVLHHLLNRENSRKLSRREAEVFYLTGCGYVPRRVAQITNLSVKTVETYRERIREKMSLKSGADLLYCSTRFMRAAARRGLEGSDEEVVRELLSATG